MPAIRMRILRDVSRRSSRLVAWLWLGVSAAALTVAIKTMPARALELDNVDGLITDTVANRERLKNWDNIKNYGAETVNERDRGYVEPDGIRAGNYMIYPTVGAAVVFDDNIFASDAAKASDWRTDTTAGIEFQSHLPRHVLDFSLDGKIVNYLEHTDQNYENYRAKVDAALHFDAAHTIATSLLSELEHEERDDPLAAKSAKGPVPVWHNRASVGITRDVGRLYGTLAATAENFNYSDVSDTNYLPLDQDARDTAVYSSQLKLGYRFSPGFEFVSKLRTSVDKNHGIGILDRDAWGYEAMAGLAFETNPLLRWRILGGYGVKDFELAGLQSIGTSLIEADVQWLPTQRLTIYGTLARQISEAVNIDASGVVQSGAKLRADYEIYHNLVLSGALEYKNYEFHGISRDDDVYSARAGLDYYFTKNWLFTFAYEHQVRDSTDDSLDMHRNKFMIGAKLRF